MTKRMWKSMIAGWAVGFVMFFCLKDAGVPEENLWLAPIVGTFVSFIAMGVLGE
jgi:hypothetical protein